MFGGSALYVGHLFLKSNSQKVYKYFEETIFKRKELHRNAARYRKEVSPKIRKVLAEVVKGTGADRAMVFEFSNGTSNLVGLPFLFTSVTSEVKKPNLLPIAQKYQKINTSLISPFLETLELEGYFYTRDVENIKEENPSIYNFLTTDKVKSAMFYSLYGMDDTIGFIVITSQEKYFDRKHTLPKTAAAAQIISSMLNYNDLTGENKKVMPT